MNNQFGRKITLVVFDGDKGLDLSEFRIRFQIENADVESPNNATIRVYNLAASTVEQIKKEYSQVSLNAGYENGNFGVIFQGSIKQYRVGKESNTDTYLDILAADGDIGYNQGVVNTTLAKGHTQQDQINALVDAMPGLQLGYVATYSDAQHVSNLRGKVLFGMARAQLRNVASTLNYSWSIQNGKVVMIPLTGYLPGEMVEINQATGLIGFPQQTDGGIKLQCLLNSKIRVGGLVKLNNQEIIQLMQQNPNAAPIPYNQYTGFQYNTPLSKDGTYRAFVVEHEGDSRGREWYTNLICLAVNTSATDPTNTSVSRGV